MSTFYSLWDIKQELVVFLRNQDIISISDRGVTTSQDTGTFSADSTHTLQTNPTLVKNVRNVNVGGSDLSFGTDYTVNYVTGVISFTSPQTGAFTIDYDQGTTDRIFPDYPQPYVKKADFPRIGFDIIDGTVAEVELGAGSNISQFTVRLNCYDIDQKDVEQLTATVKQKVQENKKNFYYFPFITPTVLGSMLPSPFGSDKVFQRSHDYEIRFVYDLI